jgi:hypothetical protein
MDVATRYGIDGAALHTDAHVPVVRWMWIVPMTSLSYGEARSHIPARRPPRAHIARSWPSHSSALPATIPRRLPFTGCPQSESAPQAKTGRPKALKRPAPGEEIMQIRSLMLAAASTALAISAFAVPAAAGGEAQGAKVFVAHGIPGAKVDVCVGDQNATEVKSNFKYGNKFKLGAGIAPGTYRIRVFLADPRECRGTKVIDESVTLTNGLNATAVAKLVKGAPGLQVFVNDIGLADDTSVTVRHTAKAPAVDVYLAQVLVAGNGGQQPTIGSFPKGASAGPVGLDQGTYIFWATLPGQTAPVIGPTSRFFKAGRAYQIHAVGTNASNYRFIVIGQTGDSVK